MDISPTTAASDASDQIMASFRRMMPHFQVEDKTLNLAPNPALPKRQRRDQETKSKQGPGKPVRENQGSPDPALLLMAKMLLKLDQEIQLQRREDTFIFFFSSQDQDSGIHCLVSAAEKWKAQDQQEPRPAHRPPLRQALIQALLSELLTRLTKLCESDPKSEMIAQAKQANILLPDLTCPFLEWDASSQALRVSSRTPLSLKKMIQNTQELVEMFTDPSLVQAFYSLPKTGNTTPWRLQMSIRADHQYQLMKSLAGSGIWMLLAASLKAHTLTQSALAQQLAQSMDMPHQRSKGKGKGKQPKMEQ